MHTLKINTHTHFLDYTQALKLTTEKNLQNINTNKKSETQNTDTLSHTHTHTHTHTAHKDKHLCIHHSI